MPQVEPIDALDNGRVDFRALVEAYTNLMEADLKRAQAEADPSFGPPPDGVDPEEWNGRKREAIEEAQNRQKVAQARFILTKDAFEDDKGPLMDYYFARTVKDAGTALTAGSYYVTKARPLLRIFRPTSGVSPAESHVHNVVLFDLPDEPAFVSLRVGFAELLHQIDAKLTSVRFMLSGLSRRLLTIRLSALRRDMLVDLDKAREALGCHPDATPSTSRNKKAVGRRLAEALKDYKEEFAKLEQTYGQAATREARIIYLSGMLVGILLLAMFSAVLGLLLSIADLPIDLDTFFTCLAAGAVGAFVSVLQRMSSGKFRVNHESGREYVQRLAYFRPFLGSIFGLAVFFAFEGGLGNVSPPTDTAKRYAFFAFVSFLAGFSERFAQEFLGSASGSDTEAPGAAADSTADSRRVAARFDELAEGNGDHEVVIETTRATSTQTH
jgi:hypothetical protein